MLSRLSGGTDAFHRPIIMEISDIRQRLQQAIARARQSAVDRRTRADAAGIAYETFLTRVARPLVKQVANALTAEGHRFAAFTPASGVRLASERSSEDFVELELDVSSDRAALIGRTSRGRGGRKITSERVLCAAEDIDRFGEDDLLDFLLMEIGPLVER